MNSDLISMTRNLLTTLVDKVHVLEGVFKEHEAIKREVSVLQELVEHSKGSSSDSNHKYSVFGSTTTMALDGRNRVTRVQCFYMNSSLWLLYP